MKCGINCPRYYFSLRLPIGTGPICKRYMLPLLDAREKCFAAVGTGRAKRRMFKYRSKMMKSTSVLPGALRGFGPITMPLQGEEAQ